MLQFMGLQRVGHNLTTEQQKQNVRLETFSKKLVASLELMRSHKYICLSRAGMRASPMALAVKNPPAVQQMQVQSLGQEDPMKEEIETHSSILVWKIPWAEEPGRLQSLGSQRVRHD